MKNLFSILLLCLCLSAAGQTLPDADSLRIEQAGLKLRAVAAMDSAWFHTIDVSVGRMPLSELIRNVARTSGVNLSIKGVDGIMTTGNFTDARVIDLVFFLCKEHRLDLDAVGTIVSIYPAAAPVPIVKHPDMHYLLASSKLSYNLAQDKLVDVIRRIAELTGVNVIVPEGLLARSVSGFVGALPVDEAIVALASINGLTAVEQEGVWRLELPLPPVQVPSQPMAQLPQGDSVKVVAMRYRSVATVEDLIPERIKEGVQIKTFPDLNSIILSGEALRTSRVEEFLRSIDRRVPLVTMEIIIADVTKTDIREAGVEAGIGQAPVQTSGTLSPGIDMTLGAASVNNLINSFNGFGSVNLGKVNPNFYMTLKLLEQRGDITINSTPRLSTLNGHEATLKSGEKRYYKEIINSYFGSQTPIQNESYTWKDVEANMSIKITPFVSEDQHITLDIEIEQTEFTDQAANEAPPGTATRSFKSLIRVQNEEMVLLGGIERNSTNKSSGGIPFVARIPVLKWIFGSATDNKTDNKLSIFIKPTIIE